MIIEEIKNIKTGKKELRNFGIIIGIFLALLGLGFLWRAQENYSYFFIFSIISLFSALVWPDFLKPFYKIWMSLAIIIGWLMTRVILVALFYLVFSPVGLLMKLMARDSLDLKFKKNPQTSYWIKKEKKEFKKSDYEKQY